MIESLFHTGISNACLALVLALIALLVSRTSRNAHLSHLLWLLVFVKLLTPALFTFSLPGPAIADHAPTTTEQPAPETETAPGTEPAVYIEGPVAATDTFPNTVASEPSAEIAAHETIPVTSAHLKPLWQNAKPWVIGLWIVGSFVVLCWSLFRVVRFHRLLARQTEDAPEEILRRAQRIAAQLGLGTLPRIRTTRASITPMVWWVGGRVNVILPADVLDKMEPEEWHWVLAHELAHVRRRDFIVRWLEWCACVLFWWNPVIWLAQRRLRIAEEICCDQLVLSKLEPEPRTYANSILSVVETLMRPVHRPPAMASEVNSGGNLENRMKLIVNRITQRRSRPLAICVALAAAVILPLGLVYGKEKKQDPRNAKYNAVESKILEALEGGEITAAEAQQKLIAVRTDLYAEKKQASPETESAAKSKKMPLQHYFKNGAKRDAKDHHHQFQESVNRLKSAVRERQLSPEDAAKHLERLKKEFARETDLVGQDRKLDAEMKLRIAEYERAFQAQTNAAESTERLKNDLGKARRENEVLQRYLVELEEIKTAMAEGKSSPADVAEQMKRASERLQAGLIRKGEDDDTRKAEYQATEREVDAAVRAGKATREQAEKHLEGLRRHFWPDEPNGEKAPDPAEFDFGNSRKPKTLSPEEIADWLEVLDRVPGRAEDRIDAKTLTEAEFRDYSEAVENHQLSRDARYWTASLEVEHAIKVGTMSREEGAKVLGRLKKRVLAEEEARKNDLQMRQADDQAKRAEYQATQAATLQAVEAGELSEEDATLRLTTLRKQLWPGKPAANKAKAREHEKSNNDQAARMAEYEAAAAAIKADASAGKITAELAKKRIDELKRHLSPGSEKDLSTGSLEEHTRRRYYKSAAADIEAALEAGHITWDQAEKQLKELVQRLWPESGDSQKDDGASNVPEEEFWSDAGIGVRIPAAESGPVRLEIGGYPIETDKLDGSDGKFNFVMGWSF